MGCDTVVEWVDHHISNRLIFSA